MLYRISSRVRAGVKERLEDTQHELNRTTQQVNTTKQELESLRDQFDKLRYDSCFYTPVIYYGVPVYLLVFLSSRTERMFENRDFALRYPGEDITDDPYKVRQC